MLRINVQTYFFVSIRDTNLMCQKSKHQLNVEIKDFGSAKNWKNHRIHILHGPCGSYCAFSTKVHSFSILTNLIVTANESVFRVILICMTTYLYIVSTLDNGHARCVFVLKRIIFKSEYIFSRTEVRSGNGNVCVWDQNESFSRCSLA